MNIINVETVSKGFGDKVLLDKVCLGINDGDKIGVIGVNGCGKSTLLKIIAGIEEPDCGRIVKNREAGISYLSQNTDFLPDDTILSYVMRGKTSSNANWNLEAEAKTILKKLNMMDVHASVIPLSGGEKKRVALAKTLLSPSKILILDEPTNHLDSSMVMWLEEYLKRFQGVLIMVTHDRYFLDRVTEKIVEIDKGKLYSYDTNYSGFLELRKDRILREQATYDKIQNVLRTEIEWVRRGAQARSTKQKARLERFEQMSQVAAPVQDKQVEMDSLSSRLGKKTIEINDISKSYGDKPLFQNFTYYTIRNERIGIVGENGCGKTTLLRIIMGMEKPDSGSIEIGETIRIGYFSQMAEELDLNQRVIDAVKDVAEYIKTSKGLTSASQMCERFLFTPDIQYNPIGKLSGGERRRLHLLKVLMTAPNVLILDEPTNDLDITTLTILEDYLDAFEGIVIAVSHDRYFLDRIVDRVFAFENGKVVQYEGNYSDYLEKTTFHSVVRSTHENKKNSGSSNWKEKDKKLKFTYQEKREFEIIDDEIEKLESMITALDEEIQRLATDFTKLQELSQKKEECESCLEEKMERWMYLSELNEKIQAQKNE